MSFHITNLIEFIRIVSRECAESRAAPCLVYIGSEDDFLSEMSKDLTESSLNVEGDLNSFKIHFTLLDQLTSLGTKVDGPSLLAIWGMWSGLHKLSTPGQQSSSPRQLHDSSTCMSTNTFLAQITLVNNGFYGKAQSVMFGEDSDFNLQSNEETVLASEFFSKWKVLSESNCSLD